MTRFQLLVSLCFLALFPTSAIAQAPIVVNPQGLGDYTSLQAALDAAPPNATIWVQGGVYNMIRVTKPVRLVADPVARITPDLFGPETWTGFGAPPCAQLEGPGFGEVLFSNFVLEGKANGFVFGTANPAIVGYGFSDLTILSSEVRAPEWEQLTGAAEGSPGIGMSGLQRLWIQDSTITGSSADIDGGYEFYKDGPPGISVGAHVVVLDSIVRGGGGAPIYHEWAANWCPCPHLPGSGGPGIAAPSVVHSGSTIEGGPGGPVIVDLLFGGGWHVGQQPNGVPFQSPTVTELPVDFAVQGQLKAGATLVFWIGPNSSPGWLLVGVPAAHPWQLGASLAFVDPTLPFFALPVGGPTTFVTLPAQIPGVGSTLMVQSLGVFSLELSRPQLLIALP